MEFAKYEHVWVATQPLSAKDPVVGKVGTVIGKSEPYEDGRRDYAVHFNYLGEARAISEEHLVSVGTIGRHEDIVTRSRLYRRLSQTR